MLTFLLKQHKSSQLQEQIGRYSPGNEVKVGYIRNGDLRNVNVVLRNTKGDTSIVKESLSLLGAEFEPVSEADRAHFQLNSGVQVTNLSGGKLKDAGVQKKFIITDVNKISVSSKEDIERILMQTTDKKPVLVEGIYPDGQYAYYVLKPVK